MANKAVGPNLFLSKILKKGSRLLDKNPSFLDKFTYAGHYPIGTIDFTKSHGPHLVNTRGVQYYDATAYWKTNMVDYTRHPELESILTYLGKLAMDAPTLSEMNTPEQSAFTDMMLSFWPAAKHVFTHPSGALAVNDACWTAAAAVAEKKKLEPREMKGVVFEGAFHGRHDRGADATHPSHKVDFRQNKNRLIRCISPAIVFDDQGTVLIKETAAVVKKSMAQVTSAFKDPKTAYVILEYPFQAEGGATLIEKGVLKNLHDLCQKYGKFLIVDCVQMGGRSWTRSRNGVVSPFAPETLKYADIITFGKIFRVSGFMAKNPTTLKRGFKQDTMTANPSRIGSTWVGRADQVLAGTAIVSTILAGKIWGNGLKNTGKILTKLGEISKDGVLIRPRGRSEDTTYVGWDFATSKIRDEFVATMREKYHIIMLGAGEKSIRWAPFLDATGKEIDHVLNSIESVCIDLSKRSK